MVLGTVVLLPVLYFAIVRTVFNPNTVPGLLRIDDRDGLCAGKAFKQRLDMCIAIAPLTGVDRKFKITGLRCHRREGGEGIVVL